MCVMHMAGSEDGTMAHGIFTRLSISYTGFNYTLPAVWRQADAV